METSSPVGAADAEVVGARKRAAAASAARDSFLLRIAFLPWRGVGMWGVEERVRTLVRSIGRCRDPVNTLQCGVTSDCERCDPGVNGRPRSTCPPTPRGASVRSPTVNVH
ncbi:hypothetical protein GCM10017674_19680 [Streptomyces gardneri]|uniref:Uncharacterized protein n=1 Tax=Streptomyces gardneri TaxID=66892 RepID=A0A4Y3RQ81_9ACTN|nr:hypothetical protein SGA01_47830 [Streptomyces gardneri]GHG91368.1 hypothetical protein GCM10017674_19680 [Streptomyces gardneri]